MARRRRGGGDDPSGAFELFLDTACNAFGGIIFISLLVCVLLQLSGVMAAPDDPREIERLKQQLADVEQDIARLEEARTQQVYQIGTLQPRYDAETEALFARLADELRHRQTEKREVEAKRDLAKIDLAAVKELLRKLQAAERQVRDTEAALDKALTATPAAPPPKGNPPVAGMTKMKPVEVFVSSRRLIFAKQYDSRGNPSGTNAADITVSQETRNGRPRTCVRPTPGRGLEITDRNQLDAALGTQLGKFQNRASGTSEQDCEFFQIFVWPDSYAECEALVRLLADRHFSYMLVLQEAGEPVIITAATPGEHPVLN